MGGTRGDAIHKGRAAGAKEEDALAPGASTIPLQRQAGNTWRVGEEQRRPGSSMLLVDIDIRRFFCSRW